MRQLARLLRLAAMSGVLASATLPAQRPVPRTVSRFVAAREAGDLRTARALVADGASISTTVDNDFVDGSMEGLVAYLRGCRAAEFSVSRELDDPASTGVLVGWTCSGRNIDGVSISTGAGRITSLQYGVFPLIRMVPSADANIQARAFAHQFMTRLIGRRDWEGANAMLVPGAPILARGRRLAPTTLRRVAVSLETCAMGEVRGEAGRRIFIRWSCPHNRSQLMTLDRDGDSVTRIVMFDRLSEPSTGLAPPR